MNFYKIRITCYIYSKMKSIGGNLSPQGMLSQACEDDDEEEEGGAAAGGGGGDNRAATDSTAAEDGDDSSSDTDDDAAAAVVKSCPTSPANRRRVGLRKRGDADPR